MWSDSDDDLILVGSTGPAAGALHPAVQELMNMGFSREQAQTSLECFDFDVTRAVNMLVQAPPPQIKSEASSSKDAARKPIFGNASGSGNASGRAHGGTPDVRSTERNTPPKRSNGCRPR